MRRKISLIILTLIMLVILTGCTNENMENANTMQNSVNNNEEVNDIETNNLGEDRNNENQEKLTEEKALEIGYDLYSYGVYPGYYDSDTNQDFSGKSRRINKYEESITIDEVFLGYPFGNNEDIDNYFTDKRIKELEKQEEPYRIKKVDGLWYFGHAPVGSEPDFMGVILTVKSIEENKVEFTATNYLSLDYLQNGDKDYENYLGKELYEYIDDFKSKYKYETVDFDFIILKENGNWKIDVQNLTHY